MTKKLFILLMSVLLVAALLAGCGSPSAPSTLREYMEANPEELAEFEAEMEVEVQQMAAMGIDMSIALEIVGDHELVLIYTLYDEDFLAGTDAGEFMAQFLADSLAADAPFFTEMATEMREEIEVDTLYITMRYRDANGVVLAERTFAGH